MNNKHAIGQDYVDIKYKQDLISQSYSQFEVEVHLSWTSLASLRGLLYSCGSAYMEFEFIWIWIFNIAAFCDTF